jgi:hypothetical protein
MKTILQSSAMILLIAVGTFAQQPAQPRFQTRLQSVVDQTGVPATKNYQLELTVQRGDKIGRYKLTLNGGSVNTELMDRFSERVEGFPPLTFSFNTTLTPFEEGNGAEANVFLTRSIAYKGKERPPQVPPGGVEREVTLFKSIPLTTKVALFPGKAVTIFKDEEEKISLKLSELTNEGEKQ